MKRTLPIILMLALAASCLAGCGGTQSTQNPAAPEEGATLSVVSTIFPGYDFAREIAGEHATVKMLLPPGSESHTFEPTPQDIITIQNCDLFVYVGGVSDTWVEGILDSMDRTKMTILPMMELVEIVEEEIKEGMQEEEHDGDDHDEEESEYDEHVWTSPVNAAHISRAIADALAGLDEANADTYRANCEDYVRRLGELDAAFREAADTAVRRTLIFGDRFPFRYFVDEYALDYFAAFPGCSTDTEASMRTVVFLIEKIRAEKIPVVFYIEFSNGKIADTICEETGAKKLLFHSCHNLTAADFDSGVTYIDLMTRNLEHLKEAIC